MPAPKRPDTPNRHKASAARNLTHVDASGRVRMVDVAAKAETAREAVAEGEIRMNAAARRAIRRPLQTARLAGIMAAKRTSEIVPLCHPLPLTHVDVELTPRPAGYRITARVGTVGRTERPEGRGSASRRSPRSCCRT